MYLQEVKFFRTVDTRVFVPSFLLLAASVVLSLVAPDQFLDATKSANDWILEHFDWLFSWSTFLFLVILVAVYISPFGKLRIGGKDATPLLSRWKWFSITLCTTIATGILFWGTAEPMFHFRAPPSGLGLDAESEGASVFAMSTMFMHWTFTPYGIYTIAGLTFAICYYNYKQPFSLGAIMYPVLGNRSYGWWSIVANNICVFALVAGMAASLGAGILTLSGGMNAVFGTAQNDMVNLIICLFLVVAFIASAASGLMKGIKTLSDINIKAFIGLAVFVLLAGPIIHMVELGGKGLVDYGTNFLSRSTGIGTDLNPEWNQSWTVFYWANWLAWTPITAMFLGSIARGYTVREFIRFNLLYTSLFGMVWMIIFSGNALSLAGDAPELADLALDGRPENVIYAMFALLPMKELVSGIFLLIAFLSYITAADSNTTALSGISSKDIVPEDQPASLTIKIIWGIVIGAVAYVMITFSGIEGIKMTSTIGGFPALFLVIVTAIVLMRLVLKGDILNEPT